METDTCRASGFCASLLHQIDGISDGDETYGLHVRSFIFILSVILFLILKAVSFQIIFYFLMLHLIEHYLFEKSRMNGKYISHQ